MVGYKGILVNPYKGYIARKLQLFQNFISLWQDTSFHFRILCDKPQIYARDCKEKGLLYVLKYEQRCDKCQSILESNAIKSIKSIITRRGENYERSKEISSALTFNSYDISFIDRQKKQYLDLNQSGMLMKFHIVSSIDYYQEIKNLQLKIGK